MIFHIWIKFSWIFRVKWSDQITPNKSNFNLFMSRMRTRSSHASPVTVTGIRITRPSSTHQAENEIASHKNQWFWRGPRTQFNSSSERAFLFYIDFWFFFFRCPWFHLHCLSVHGTFNLYVPMWWEAHYLPVTKISLAAIHISHTFHSTQQTHGIKHW